MPDNTVTRNCNILARLDSSTGTNPVELYRPGYLNPYNVQGGLKFSGYINSLRVIARISSVAELVLPTTSEYPTQQELDKATEDMYKNNPKKCLRLFFGTSTTPSIDIGDVIIYNQQPLYYIDLLRYFTSNIGFPCASDSVISCQVIDYNHGLLTGNDNLVIIGSVIEEAYNSPDILGLQI